MTATMEPLVDTLIEDARWEAFGLTALAEDCVACDAGGAAAAARRL